MSYSVRLSLLSFAFASILLAGCGAAEALHGGSDSDAAVGGTGGTGGNAGNGGMAVGGTGGAIVGSGGNGTMTGGTGGAIVGSGGSTASGGTTGSGGRIGSGGATASGGRVGSGGTVGSGGATGTGGAVGSGGVAATGGRVGSGGAVGTGGVVGGLFSDDFETGADGWIATNAADWSVVNDGGMVYREGATATNLWRGSAAGNTAWTNVMIEAKVKILTLTAGSTGYFVAVCGRVSDANNRYCLALRSDGKIAIRKILNGSGTSGAAVNVLNGIALNTWYTARLQIVGSAVTGMLYLNGAQLGVATDTDTSIAAGGIMLGTQNGSAEFDDVVVTVQ